MGTKPLSLSFPVALLGALLVPTESVAGPDDAHFERLRKADERRTDAIRNSIYDQGVGQRKEARDRWQSRWGQSDGSSSPETKKRVDVRMPRACAALRALAARSQRDFSALQEVILPEPPDWQLSKWNGVPINDRVKWYGKNCPLTAEQVSKLTGGASGKSGGGGSAYAGWSAESRRRWEESNRRTAEYNRRVRKQNEEVAAHNARLRAEERSAAEKKAAAERRSQAVKRLMGYVPTYFGSPPTPDRGPDGKTLQLGYELKEGKVEVFTRWNIEEAHDPLAPRPKPGHVVTRTIAKRPNRPAHFWWVTYTVHMGSRKVAERQIETFRDAYPMDWVDLTYCAEHEPPPCHSNKVEYEYSSRRGGSVSKKGLQMLLDPVRLSDDEIKKANPNWKP